MRKSEIRGLFVVILEFDI